MKRIIVQSEQALSRMFETLDRHERSSNDSEFVPCARHQKADLIAWSFAVRDGNGYTSWYVPLGHELHSAYDRKVFDAPPVNIPTKAFLAKGRKYFEHKSHVHVCHSAETESGQLRHNGIELSNIRDTMIEAWMFDEERLYPYRLKEIAPKCIGYKMKKISEVVSSAKIREVAAGGSEKANLSSVPVDLAALYGTDDAIATLMLHEWFEPQLKAEEVWDAYTRIELPMVPIFRDMNHHGIRINTKDCREQLSLVSRRQQELEGEIYKIAGRPFNLNSRPQLGQILFEELGLPEMEIPDPTDPSGERKIPYRTPTGKYKTDDAVMIWLESQGFPIATCLREFGDLEKIRGTYLQSFLDDAQADSDARIHPSLWQCGTVTGRASGPMQQAPRPDKDFDLYDGRISVRRLVVAPPGSWLVCADYNQLELRLFAHFSQDPALTGSYLRGEDLHQGTTDAIRAAAQKFKNTSNVAKHLLKKALEFSRSEGKTINFGLVYGLALATFVEMFGEEIGRAVFDALMGRFSAALAYKKAVIHQAHLDGFVRTIAWRMRHLWDINSASYAQRGYVERQAFNTKIQGSAADVMKMAMIAIRRALPDIPQILQVHDEVLLEVKGTKKHAQEVAREVKRIMESVITLRVPLISEPKIAKTWLEAK